MVSNRRNGHKVLKSLPVTSGRHGAYFNPNVNPVVFKSQPITVHIHRNKPCYCGSGKKAKNCCLRKMVYGAVREDV